MASKTKDLSSTEWLTLDHDFIIIGGGTAGLTLATRLSEEPSFKVLVLEAGASHLDDPLILTPGLVGALYDNPSYDWEFKTVPQKNLSPPGRQVPHPRGKVLGGSSAIYQNKITYNSVSGFNAWEKLGNSGWNWESMKPYLRKFHTYKPLTGPVERELFDHCHVDEHLDGDDGPIITTFDGWGPSDTEFYQTVQKITMENKYDDKFLGGFASPAAIDPVSKTRSYAGNAYYNKDTAARPNLTVVTEALVQKVILERGERVFASGVEFRNKIGETIAVKARKEVILSAGTFASPQILELSGIGNPEILKNQGIEVIIDNPNVGENLQDHGLALVSFEAAEGVPTADIMKRDPSMFPALLAMYEKDRTGPLASLFTVSAYMPLPDEQLFAPSGSEALSKILSKVPADLSSHPNNKEFEQIVCDLFNEPDGSTGHYFKAPIQFDPATAKTITEMSAPKRPEDYITLLCASNFAFSRGNVHITSSSASTKPAVDPKYLSHPLDLEILARHTQWFHTLIHTEPFSKYFKPGGVRIPTRWPGDKEPSLEEAKEIVREGFISNFHPVGSCAMLPKEKGGVLDNKLKVYGVEGLRVVDASIFPIHTRGNPITSVYAVAERAADIIKSEWKGKQRRQDS